MASTRIIFTAWDQTAGSPGQTLPVQLPYCCQVRIYLYSCHTAARSDSTCIAAILLPDQTLPVQLPYCCQVRLYLYSYHTAAKSDYTCTAAVLLQGQTLPVQLPYCCQVRLYLYSFHTAARSDSTCAAAILLPVPGQTLPLNLPFCSHIRSTYTLQLPYCCQVRLYLYTAARLDPTCRAVVLLQEQTLPVQCTVQIAVLWSLVILYLFSSLLFILSSA